jgi:formiminoglutamase
MIPYFQQANKALTQQLTSLRAGEVKLGERLQIPAGESLQSILAHSTCRFVLLGIPEDIGIRANGGVGGAHTAWAPFLKSFCNIQSTDKLSGEEILLLGAFHFQEWIEASHSSSLDQLRAFVSRIDDAVYPVIETIVTAGKIPVVIGGGHNNAYPLIKGASRALGKSLAAINLDAHSDYRATEGRHSGNGFRYARKDSFLGRYAMIGLHRNYNSQAVLDDMAADPALHVSFYEDIFLKGSTTFKGAVNDAIIHSSGCPTGIELDLDCIEGVLSSAASPSGISALQARQYLYQCATQCNAAYLHLAEGATMLRDGRTDPSTGKLIAYLTADFIRSF